MGEEEYHEIFHKLEPLLPELNRLNADTPPSEFEKIKNSNLGDNIQQILESNHPNDIAEALMFFDRHIIFSFFKLADRSYSSHIFLELDERIQEYLMELLPPKELGSMVLHLDSDDAADVIADLPDTKVEEVLEHIPDNSRERILMVSNLDEDSSGHLMDFEWGGVPDFISVGNARERLRTKKEKLEEMREIYLIDREGKLTGKLPLSRLIFNDDHVLLRDISMPVEVFTRLNEDQEDVAHLFAKYDLVSMPVLDEEDRLQGIITIDDIVDVIEEERHEDALRMAGIHGEDKVNSPIFESLRNRLPWLMVNLITSLIASSVIGLFESVLAAFVILTAFLPIVGSLGGNAGNQVMTIVVRGIATGDVAYRHLGMLIFKETAVGFFTGTTIGAIAALIVYFYYGKVEIAVVVGGALGLNMLLTTLLGASVPFILKKLRIDPALASSIMVTTTSDTLGFFIYLTLAVVILIGVSGLKILKWRNLNDELFVNEFHETL